MNVQIRSAIHRIVGTTALVVSLSVALSSATQAASFTARGNEPGWRIDVSDKSLVFRGQDGKTFTIEPAPAAVTANGTDTYKAEVANQPFTLAVSNNICVDTMSGMPFPKTATVILNGQTLAGCAGEPASLLHGDWKIKEIGGKTVAAQSAPTLAFDPDGGIHGDGSCNRFFGRFTLTGEGLSISQIGASMMMCEQPLMDQERSLLKALESVQRFEAVPGGQIRLLGSDKQPLVALDR